MSAPVTAALPPKLVLAAGSVIRVTALDPTTGATVAGVTLTNVSLYVRNTTTGALSQLAFGDWQLVPGGQA